MRKWYKEWLIVLLFVLCVPWLGGCGEVQQCKFTKGEMVRTVLGDVQGQIVGVWRQNGKCWGKYNVRFLANESATDTHLFSNDGTIIGRPFQKVSMYDYELKKER